MTNGTIYNWQDSEERGYSIGWNLNTLIQKGVNENQPPETLDQLLNQIIELITCSVEEWGGLVSINCLDNYILPFVEKEKPSRQGFVSQIEQFFNRIAETGITVSITLDLIHRPSFEESEKAQVILDAVNNVIADISLSMMSRGVFKPYIGVNLYPETSWDSPVLDKWLTLSYQYGQPTYNNFITGTIAPETLQPRAIDPDPEAQYIRIGGVLGNAENQSVTSFSCINLAKIAAEARDETEFFDILDETVDQAQEHLEAKRNLIEKKLEQGELPLTSQFIDDLDWSFSVITLAGMNEALETLIDAPLGHVAGKAVTYKVLESLIRKLENIQYDTGYLYSLESYPSENPGAELLKEYDAEEEYLTPATELKPSHGDDLWDALEHEKKYHSMYTGGTLEQIHLKKGLDYNQGLKLLIKRTIENFGYNYLAITPVFSLCREHGYIKGEAETCPVCGKETTSYTRIDHKITPTGNLPKPLKEAYRQRAYYDVKNQ